MPRHARGGPRALVSSVASCLIGLAIVGGLATWEASRIAAARDTVHAHWGAGIAVGAGAGLALPGAIFAVAALFRHRRLWWRGRPQVIALLVLSLLWIVAFLTSTPPRQHTRHPAPNVITSAVEVAEIAYVDAWLLVCTVLIAVLGLLALVGRSSPG